MTTQYERRKRPARYRHANRHQFTRLERYRPIANYYWSLKAKADLEADAIAKVGDFWPAVPPDYCTLKMFRD